MNAIDICSRAMRQARVLAAGEIPTEEDLDDAIETLKSILLRAVSEGAFGRLNNAIATEGDFIAEPMTRVVRNNADNTSITLPETITNEDGETDLPYDRSVIAIADQLTNQTVTYIYDLDVARWLPIETMTATSVVPLSARDAKGLSAYLSVEISDEYGQEVREATARAALRFNASLLNGQSRPRQRHNPPEWC